MHTLIMTCNRFVYSTPVGKITIADDSNGKIAYVALPGKTVPFETVEKESEIIKKAGKQLEEYFAGRRKDFDIPLNPNGTEFQIKVWRELCKVPYGKTITYKDLAVKVGNPNGARAIGMAMNRNPIAIIAPCHRIVGHDGSLTGYAGGLDLKKKLLKLEGVIV